MAEYIDKSKAYDYATLYDWLISSVGPEPPVWTEAHIDELMSDFLIFPNDTPAADMVERPRWIPVTERLPNEKQAEDVLCWIIDGDSKSGGYCVSGCYNTLAKLWCLDADWVDPRKITHWMPAPQGPEPPKEGQP